MNKDNISCRQRAGQNPQAAECKEYQCQKKDSDAYDVQNFQASQHVEHLNDGKCVDIISLGLKDIDEIEQIIDLGGSTQNYQGNNLHQWESVRKYFSLRFRQLKDQLTEAGNSIQIDRLQKIKNPHQTKNQSSCESEQIVISQKYKIIQKLKDFRFKNYQIFQAITPQNQIVVIKVFSVGLKSTQRLRIITQLRYRQDYYIRLSTNPSRIRKINDFRWGTEINQKQNTLTIAVERLYFHNDTLYEFIQENTNSYQNNINPEKMNKYIRNLISLFITAGGIDHAIITAFNLYYESSSDLFFVDPSTFTASQLQFIKPQDKSYFSSFRKVLFYLDSKFFSRGNTKPKDSQLRQKRINQQIKIRSLAILLLNLILHKNISIPLLAPNKGQIILYEEMEQIVKQNPRKIQKLIKCFQETIQRQSNLNKVDFLAFFRSVLVQEKQLSWKQVRAALLPKLVQKQITSERVISEESLNFYFKTMFELEKPLIKQWYKLHRLDDPELYVLVKSQVNITKMLKWNSIFDYLSQNNNQSSNTNILYRLFLQETHKQISKKNQQLPSTSNEETLNKLVKVTYEMQKKYNQLKRIEILAKQNPIEIEIQNEIEIIEKYILDWEICKASSFNDYYKQKQFFKIVLEILKHSRNDFVQRIISLLEAPLQRLIELIKIADLSCQQQQKIKSLKQLTRQFEIFFSLRLPKYKSNEEITRIIKDYHLTLKSTQLESENLNIIDPKARTIFVFTKFYEQKVRDFIVKR